MQDVLESKLNRNIKRCPRGKKADPGGSAFSPIEMSLSRLNKILTRTGVNPFEIGERICSLRCAVSLGLCGVSPVIIGDD
jgi:hypothetical protein